MRALSTAGGAAAGLALLTLVAFLPVLDNQFVSYDDRTYITENPHVRGGLTAANARWALTAFHANNWHPLAWISHQLDVSLHGLDPRWHHGTSLLLHAGAAVLLLLCLIRMTGAPAASALVAALFALHPLRVESVAWAAERKDVLGAFFWFLTTLAWVRYARRPGVGRYLLVAVALALGLASKPTLVTLPLILLLLDLWPLGRHGAPGSAARPGTTPLARLALEKVPLLALSAAAAAATYAAQSTTGAVLTLRQVPLAERLENAVVACAVYLGKMAVPAGLAVFYPLPEGGHPRALVLGASVLAAGISLLAFRQRLRRPWLAVGWLWYLVALLPTLGIVKAGGQAYADRYTYLPMAGALLAAVWTLRDATAGWQGGRRAALALFGVGVVASLVPFTRAQTRLWHDDLALFGQAVRVTSRNWLAETNLGVALAERGRFAEAIAHHEAALKIAPSYADARYHLGLALAGAGDSEGATAQYLAVLRLRPDANAENNLGSALATQGRVDEAIPRFQKAAELDPELKEAFYNLGVAYAARGRYAEAAASHRAALRIRPDYPQALTELGVLLAREGRSGEARGLFAAALRADPGYAPARSCIGQLDRLGPQR